MEKNINSMRFFKPEWKCVDDDQDSNNRLHYSRFALSPLLVDEAMTIGVAMRRALLSEVESICITSVQIAGAIHEYSTLEGIRESIDEILMNLKQIVLKGQAKKEESASIFAQGPGVVTAGHISFGNSSIIAVDPNQYIATLSKNTQICIELRIRQGKGSHQIHNIKKEDGSKNEYIDAKFTPVQKANFSIYSLGEGKERHQLLLLEVWTNKTVTPEEALYQAHNSLLNLFYTITPPIPSKHISKFDNGRSSNQYKNRVYSDINSSDQSGHVLNSSVENILSIERNLDQVRNPNNISIDELELSPRIYNCLKKANIHTVSDLVSYTPDELLKIKNFGRKSVEQVVFVLQKRFGLQLSTINK
jgi:DNA-directed RNA polymerase subunit alpha